MLAVGSSNGDVAVSRTSSPCHWDAINCLLSCVQRVYFPDLMRHLHVYELRVDCMIQQFHGVAGTGHIPWHMCLPTAQVL